MSIGSADVVKKIVSLWGASTLDATFKAYWSASDLAENFIVLNDKIAEGVAPYPYCNFELDEPRVSGRMSGLTSGIKQQIREYPLTFTIHARDAGGSKSAKEIAADMAEAVMAVFGGHPTTTNSVDGASLDNGGILISQYQSDFALRENIENWAWVIKYSIRADVPVAV